MELDVNVNMSKNVVVAIAAVGSLIVGNKIVRHMLNKNFDNTADFNQK